MESHRRLASKWRRFLRKRGKYFLLLLAAAVLVVLVAALMYFLTSPKFRMRW